MSDNWIEPAEVATLLQTDLGTDSFVGDLIRHAQALAELEVGTQEAPNARLKALLAQIVARMWQAGKSAQQNPAALQGEWTGPSGYQNPHAGAAGLGLTNRERADLRRAVGLGGLWVQPTSRGDDLEMSDPDMIAAEIGWLPVNSN